MCANGTTVWSAWDALKWASLCVCIVTTMYVCARLVCAYDVHMHEERGKSRGGGWMGGGGGGGGVGENSNKCTGTDDERKYIAIRTITK